MIGIYHSINKYKILKNKPKEQCGNPLHRKLLQSILYSAIRKTYINGGIDSSCELDNYHGDVRFTCDDLRFNVHPFKIPAGFSGEI